MTLSERVKLARTKRGMGQRELAEQAGLSSGYLSQLENVGDGARIKSPGLAITRKLADALHVPFDWLAFGAGPVPTWDESADFGSAL